MILITALMMFFGLFGDSRPEHIKLSQKISENFAKEVKAQRNFKFIGRGGSLFENVEKVSLSFKSEDYSNIANARIILVEMRESLITHYNNDEKIRPYLSNFPFIPKNIEITIFFEKKQLIPSQKLVSSVFPIEHLVYYYLYDSSTGAILETYTETYEEAYKIVYGHERPK